MLNHAYRMRRKRAALKELERKITAAANERDGKLFLSCRAAHNLANELNVELLEIGAICERKRIKIVACQLGCFNGDEQ